MFDDLLYQRSCLIRKYLSSNRFGDPIYDDPITINDIKYVEGFIYFFNNTSIDDSYIKSLVRFNATDYLIASTGSKVDETGINRSYIELVKVDNGN